MVSKRGKSSQTTRNRLQTNATNYKPLKQLPFDPKMNRQLQLNEQWRIVAKAYLLDPIFFTGIQSLELKDPKMLEKAANYLKNPSERVQRDLCGRAKLLVKDFDRYKPSSKSNEYTDMWLRMATMIYQTVAGRLAAHPEDLLEQVVTSHQHFLIVTALLFEVLADWDSPPDSFLKRRYLFDIDGHDEGSSGSSGQKRKRDVDDQIEDNKTNAEPRDETDEETTGEVEEGPSRMSDHGVETTFDSALHAEQESMMQATISTTSNSNENGQHISQEDASGIRVGPVAPQSTKFEENGEAPNSDETHTQQQPAAPTAVMVAPTQAKRPKSPTEMMSTTSEEAGQAIATGTKQVEQTKGETKDNILGHEKQDTTEFVEDLEGSVANGIVAEQAEQAKDESSDDDLRCEKPTGTKSVKDLEGSAADNVAEGDTMAEVPRAISNEGREKCEQAEQSLKDRIHELEQSGQKAKDRIRELEQKLREANSKSGNDQTK